jgi:hypothetical protein
MQLKSLAVFLGCCEATMNYRNFEIETREIGRGLWHARVSRADHKPTLIDGNEFEYLDVGVAWPSVEAALADAQKFIDLMSRRFDSAA